MALYPGHETGFLGYVRTVRLEPIGRTEREVPPDRTVLLERAVISELAATAVGLEVDRGIGVEQVRDRAVYREVLVDAVVRVNVGYDELVHSVVLIPRRRQRSATRIAEAVSRGRRTG